MENIADVLIEIRNLKKTCRQGPVSTEALRGIDLSVRKGESLGIVGRSGAGKTTLLDMIADPNNLPLLWGMTACLGYDRFGIFLIRKML